MVTVAFFTSPFIIMFSGLATIISSIATMAGGEGAYGLFLMGTGIIFIGAGLILLPLFIKLVKLMWIAFKKLFQLIKSLFSGKVII